MELQLLMKDNSDFWKLIENYLLAPLYIVSLCDNDGWAPVLLSPWQSNVSENTENKKGRGKLWPPRK